jgi:tetratricopeptide (TPR) repeat protein
MPEDRAEAARASTQSGVGRAAVRERANLEVELAECQWFTGQGRPAQATLARALAKFERIGDADGAGAVERRIARVYWESGMRPESLEHYHRSLEILRDRPESREYAWTLSSMSQMHMLAAEYDLAVSSGERALELARGLDAQGVIAHALNNLGAALLHGWPDRSDEGEADLIESKERALQLGSTHDACRAMVNLAEAMGARGRTSDARRLLHDLVSYADRSGIYLYQRSGRHELFDLDRRCGRWRDAFTNTTWIRPPERSGPARQATRERATGALPPWRHYAETMSTIFIAAAHTDRGAASIALDLLDDAGGAILRHGELQVVLPYLGERIRALAVLGREDDVASDIDRLLQVLATTTYTFHSAVRGLLPACHWLGASGATRQRPRLRACVQELERVERQYGTPNMTAALREGEGWLALLEDDPALAAERFGDAERSWLDLGFPLDRIRALTGTQEALERIGKTREARRASAAAEAIFASLLTHVEAVASVE